MGYNSFKIDRPRETFLLKLIEYPHNIKQAALALDKIMPGWAKKINVAGLEMTSSYNCILGQLFGDYAGGQTHFKDAPACSVDDPVFGNYASINLWRVEIELRLAAPSPAAVVGIFREGSLGQLADVQDELRRALNLLESFNPLVKDRGFKVEVSVVGGQFNMNATRSV